MTQSIETQELNEERFAEGGLDYELLAQCIRSGQLSAAQIQEHLKDQLFAAWYRGTLGESDTRTALGQLLQNAWHAVKPHEDQVHHGQEA